MGRGAVSSISRSSEMLITSSCGGLAVIAVLFCVLAYSGGEERIIDAAGERLCFRVSWRNLRKVCLRGLVGLSFSRRAVGESNEGAMRTKNLASSLDTPISILRVT